MRILIIVFPQRSHVNASLNLAYQLRDEGHQVIYSGTDRLQSYVTSLGFKFHPRERDVYPWTEAVPSENRIGLRRWVSGLRRLDQYRKIYRDLGSPGDIVAETNPDLVLVDRAYSVFAPMLFKSGVPFAVLVSMGNLSHSFGIPPQCTSYQAGHSLLRMCVAELFWARYYWGRALNRYLDFRLEFDRRFLSMMEALSSHAEFRFVRSRYFHVGVREVPELLLFPSEFDFPRRLLPNQYHIGPFCGRKRDVGAHSLAFDSVFQQFQNQRATGRPLVLCALGTAAWRYKHINKFVELLVTVTKGARGNLIVAGGEGLLCNNHKDSTSNISFFDEIPQQQALMGTDLFICHGGMNSIVEAIMAGVPMLICPGMSKSDQPGNAARVCYHRIGMKISPKWMRCATIRRKIDSLLTDPTYREQAQKMRLNIESSDAHLNATQIFRKAFREHFGTFAGDVSTFSESRATNFIRQPTASVVTK